MSAALAWPLRQQVLDRGLEAVRHLAQAHRAGQAGAALEVCSVRMHAERAATDRSAGAVQSRMRDASCGSSSWPSSSKIGNSSASTASTASMSSSSSSASARRRASAHRRTAGRSDRTSGLPELAERALTRCQRRSGVTRPASARAAGRPRRRRTRPPGAPPDGSTRLDASGAGDQRSWSARRASRTGGADFRKPAANWCSRRRISSAASTNSCASAASPWPIASERISACSSARARCDRSVKPTVAELPASECASAMALSPTGRCSSSAHSASSVPRRRDSSSASFRKMLNSGIADAQRADHLELVRVGRRGGRWRCLERRASARAAARRLRLGLRLGRLGLARGRGRDFVVDVEVEVDQLDGLGHGRRLVGRRAERHGGGLRLGRRQRAVVEIEVEVDRRSRRSHRHRAAPRPSGEVEAARQLERRSRRRGRLGASSPAATDRARGRCGRRARRRPSAGIGAAAACVSGSGSAVADGCRMRSASAALATARGSWPPARPARDRIRSSRPGRPARRSVKPRRSSSARGASARRAL